MLLSIKSRIFQLEVENQYGTLYDKDRPYDYVMTRNEFQYLIHGIDFALKTLTSYTETKCGTGSLMIAIRDCRFHKEK